MGTLQGALVHVTDSEAFNREMEAYGVAVHRPASGWVFVESAAQLGNLGPLVFSKELSSALKTEIIDIAIQTTASVEEIIHWDTGELRRKLLFEGDGDGWVTQEGQPQEWESSYFFSDDEGTAKGEEWPRTLPDEVSEEDIARYNAAKATGDASRILDLLWEGSVERIFEHYGVDFGSPVATYSPSRAGQPGVWVAAFFFLMIAAIVVGAISKH